MPVVDQNVGGCTKCSNDQGFIKGMGHVPVPIGGGGKG